MPINFDKVTYTYQPNTPFESRALFEIDLDIIDGSFTALVGHTGSGKSTLLQQLNALLLPTSGTVTVDDTIIKSTSKGKEVKPVRKKVGVVFQFPETQLFDETVLKDVAFGPQNFGVSKADAEATAREKLRLVGISDDLFDRSPFELSGGQMRRVAIAGILAMNPSVLVLDEPTAGLDPKSRINNVCLAIIWPSFPFFHHNAPDNQALLFYSSAAISNSPACDLIPGIVFYRLLLFSIQLINIFPLNYKRGINFRK